MILLQKLHLFIRTQLDNQGQDLDLSEEVVEKAVNAEAKASLWPPSRIKKIDSRGLKGYKLTKKDKDKAN